jgi:large subunit ribosomal protein L19
MMLRSLTGSLCRLLYRNPTPVAPTFSTMAEREPVAPEDMPFLHHGKRPRFRDYEKFKSPRRRASKLYGEIIQEAIAKSKADRPKVWDTAFRVGDAIELENVEVGGVKAKTTSKIRGVVLGIFRKGLDHSVLIRDVLYGEPVETRIPLHSPMLRSIKVLEKNFVHKGKRKVKRAKLYYLSDRNPAGMSFVFLFLVTLSCYFSLMTNTFSLSHCPMLIVHRKSGYQVVAWKYSQKYKKKKK